MKQSEQRRRRRSAGVAYFYPLILAAIVLLAVPMATACGWGASEGDDTSPNPTASAAPTIFQPPDRSPTEMELPIRIAVTFPQFEEFAAAAGGDNVEVFSLIPQGADPHTYQFTDQDIERMKGVDFFFLNGAGLDSRLQETIEANRDEAAHVIPFAPNILSPTVSGQTAEQAADNPHLWLDPALAYVYVEIVADELVIYDGVRQGIYDANFGAFKQRLLNFLDEIQGKLQALPPDRRKIITQHNSLDHFARKFDLEVIGYSADAPEDPTAPDAVTRLAEAVREHEITAVFAENGYDQGLMQRIADQAGVQLCTLQSDIVDPALTYEEMMRANADEIVRCLGA